MYLRIMKRSIMMHIKVASNLMIARQHGLSRMLVHGEQRSLFDVSRLEVQLSKNKMCNVKNCYNEHKQHNTQK
jgi:hypothetical protein